MKTAIMIHGWPEKEEYFNPENPSSSNAHWFPWLQQQLLVNGIFTQTPEMPDAWEPRYEKWKKVFEQFPVDEETVLVGHSCGAGFLVRWLSENKITVGKVILVAPWMDIEKQDRESIGNFFDFDIDPELISRSAGVTLMYSTDDDAPMITTANMLQETLPGIVVKEYNDKGHFTFIDMQSGTFPELLEEILK